ncbi:MAG: hypothetical protein IT577_23680 [Verrucomicrobiae bacterium]|nr:hypothetical protein [Verrucomicrobiae bacterium]
MRTIPPRLRWLIPVAATGALFLTAQLGPWRNLQVNPAGILDRTNLTIPGIVSGGAFFGSGTGLGGVLGPSSTNQAYADLYPRSNPSGYVTAVQSTNIAQAAGIDTHLWAIFDIPMDRVGANGWTDLDIRASTNGFAGGGTDGMVFNYTTTNNLLNGIPEDELFSTNWYPVVVRSYRIGAENFFGPFSQKRDGEKSWETTVADVGWPGGDCFNAAVFIRDAGGWFHSASNLTWIYRRRNDSSVERDYGDYNDKWVRIEPLWVTYDPRPKKLYWINGSGDDGFYEHDNHSQP